jgi:hypothetical protein
MLVTMIVSKCSVFEDESLLGCCTVWSHGNWRRYRGAYCFHHQGDLKCRSVSWRLHGLTSQKTVIFKLPALRTWNHICLCIFAVLRFWYCKYAAWYVTSLFYRWYRGSVLRTWQYILM